MSTFGYSHSNAIMRGLVAAADEKPFHLGEGYQFVEENGESRAFYRMMEIIQQSDVRDMVFVDTIKEFAGENLSEFKEKLKALNDAGVTVYSLTEPNYNYWNTLAVIEVVEKLLPIYKHHNMGIIAATLHFAGRDMDYIRQYTKLSEAEVYQAIADCKHEYERAQEILGE